MLILDGGGRFQHLLACTGRAGDVASLRLHLGDVAQGLDPALSVLDGGGSIHRLLSCVRSAAVVAGLRLYLGKRGQRVDLPSGVFHGGDGLQRLLTGARSAGGVASFRLHRRDDAQGTSLPRGFFDGGDGSQSRRHILGVDLPQRHHDPRKVSELSILDRRDVRPGLEKDPAGFRIRLWRVRASRRLRACQKAAQEYHDAPYTDH